MNTATLPSRDEILKHTRPGMALKPIEKNGTSITSPEAAAGGSYSQWIDITPAMASNWLKNNFGNRPVKEDVVTAYARDMLNGQWVATHQGIAFNDDDRLIDGQHRLMAIVQSGITVRMMVTFNLPSIIKGKEMTTMDCVDRGRTRSVADQLTIQHGFKHGSLIASICAALSSICCGERTRRLSVGQTLEVYRAFEKSVQFVIENRSKTGGLKSAGVLAAFAFAHAAFGKPVEEKFFELNSPDQSGRFKVISLLHAFLTSDEAKLISRSLDRGLAEMTLQVLYLEHHNRVVEKLEMSLEGANWFREQQAARVDKIAAIFEMPEKPKPAEEKSAAAAPMPVASIIVTPPAPAAGKGRPTLDTILHKVESATKLSRFIITGRGRDPEIDSARTIFIHVARTAGHTAEAVASILKKDVGIVAEHFVPIDALSTKQRKAVDAIKEKL